MMKGKEKKKWPMIHISSF